MALFKTVEDKLEKLGWHFDNDGYTFVTLHRVEPFKHSTIYLGLYSSGEIEVYTYQSDEIKETILTYGEYQLILKYMKKRGWPKVG